ncbi:hypothetical protein Tco_1490985 [Tanacetum coccineum]
MLTNKGWVDGNCSNLGGGFGKLEGGRQTRGRKFLEVHSFIQNNDKTSFGRGATWVVVRDSLGDDEEV